jgi:hypothetical protein
MGSPAIRFTAPWTRLSASEEEETFYAGAYEVELHPAETAHYGDIGTASTISPMPSASDSPS